MKITLAQIVAQGIQVGASDIHIVSGLPLFFRVNGDIFPVDNMPSFTTDELWNWQEVFDDDRRQKLNVYRQLDFPLELETGERLRANAFFHSTGLSLAFRIINSKPPALDSLGLAPEVIRDIMNLDYGLVLVVGPTGQGKSTTLASIIQEKIHTGRYKIITVEDPIEYTYFSDASIIVQREVGRDVTGFKQGLKAALRQDPDILMMGEMRDLETMSAALTMAETGQLVLSTLHTNNAYQTVSRIIDSFPGDQQGQIRSQLAMNLKMIISQRLLKTEDGKGRVLAYESLKGNSAVATTIRDNKIYQLPQVIELDKSGSMMSLEESLVKLVVDGKIDRKQGLYYAGNKEHFKQLLEMTQDFPS